MCPASGGAAPERSEGASTAADAGRRVRASSRGADAPPPDQQHRPIRDLRSAGQHHRIVRPLPYHVICSYAGPHRRCGRPGTRASPRAMSRCTPTPARPRDSNPGTPARPPEPARPRSPRSLVRRRSRVPDLQRSGAPDDRASPRLRHCAVSGLVASRAPLPASGTWHIAPGAASGLTDGDMLPAPTTVGHTPPTEEAGMCPASGGAAPERSAGASTAADAGRRVARLRAARMPRPPTHNIVPSVTLRSGRQHHRIVRLPDMPIAWFVV